MPLPPSALVLATQCLYLCSPFWICDGVHFDYGVVLVNARMNQSHYCVRLANSAPCSPILCSGDQYCIAHRACRGAAIAHPSASSLLLFATLTPRLHSEHRFGLVVPLDEKARKRNLIKRFISWMYRTTAGFGIIKRKVDLPNQGMLYIAKLAHSTYSL